MFLSHKGHSHTNSGAFHYSLSRLDQAGDVNERELQKLQQFNGALHYYLSLDLE